MVRIPTHAPPIHPGEVLLEEFLTPLGITQAELAKRIGVTFARVNEIVHGRRGITLDTALRLERFFGASAESWLNAQLRWDLYHMRHSAAGRRIAQIRPATYARAS
jgi:addiction module HigA family antidote